jgi:hypothetical protein
MMAGSKTPLRRLAKGRDLTGFQRQKIPAQKEMIVESG